MGGVLGEKLHIGTGGFLLFVFHLQERSLCKEGARRIGIILNKLIQGRHGLVALALLYLDAAFLQIQRQWFAASLNPLLQSRQGRVQGSNLPLHGREQQITRRVFRGLHNGLLTQMQRFLVLVVVNIGGGQKHSTSIRVEFKKALEVFDRLIFLSQFPAQSSGNLKKLRIVTINIQSF